jgi:hypothetical protein
MIPESPTGFHYVASVNTKNRARATQAWYRRKSGRATRTRQEHGRWFIYLANA